GLGDNNCSGRRLPTWEAETARRPLHLGGPEANPPSLQVHLLRLQVLSAGSLLRQPTGMPWNFSDSPEAQREPMWGALRPSLVQVTSVYQGPFALGVSGDVVTGLLIGHYETLDVLAASLPPASLLGQGLHLRHATARDRTRRRALLVDLSPAASAGRPPSALRRALVALLSAGPFFFLIQTLAPGSRVLVDTSAVSIFWNRGCGNCRQFSREYPPSPPQPPRTARGADGHAVGHHCLLLPALSGPQHPLRVHGTLAVEKLGPWGGLTGKGSRADSLVS
ncbi:hypothetical protein U0070_022144, partial [Myodes glareolus]